MGYRRIKLATNEFYHVYNRGVDKRIIFKDTSDYRRFMELLFLSNSFHPVDIRRIRETVKSVYDFERDEPLVAIGAYCLMPNHFHILLTPIVEGGVQTFMRKVSTGYSMYFNKRYERTGVLFQGRYKSQHTDSDEYLKYLFSYIHLNPIKLVQSDWGEKGIHEPVKSLNFLETYQHSSFIDFDGIERVEKQILTPRLFPEYFPDQKSFRKEISEWIDNRTLLPE